MPPKGVDSRPRTTKKDLLGGIGLDAGSKRDLRGHRATRVHSDVQANDIPGREVRIGFDEKDRQGYGGKRYDSNISEYNGKGGGKGKRKGSLASDSSAQLRALQANAKKAPSAAAQVAVYKERADALEKKFRQMLEELREDLKKGGPIPVSDSAPREIKTKDIKGQLTLSGLKMTGFDEFMINKVQVPTPKEIQAGDFWLKYEITVPHLHVAGKFDMEGTHKKVDVRSNGEFEGDLLFYKNIGHVTFTQAEDGALEVEDYKLKIKSLGINIEEKGLKFGILGSAELKPIIDNQLHEYMQKHWKEVSPKAAQKAKDNLNAVLRRIHKERQEALIKSKAETKDKDEMKKMREEKMRQCREKIANLPNPRPPGYPPLRDQSLLGWLYPPKHPMM